MQPVHVVTGASSGVGRALCIAQAERGKRVLGIARREAALRELQDVHPDLIDIVSADIATSEGRDAVRDRVLDNYQVQSLVHSAAVSTRGYLKDMPLDTYRTAMAINLEAPIFLTQALLPSLVPGARVLQLSSGAAHRAIEYSGVYCISKAALLMAYQAWNADFPGGEYSFGSAMPGVVEGPMQDAAREGDYPGVERFREYKDTGMLIPPANVARFLIWLLEGTSKEDFAAQDWNIFDESHHEHWLKGPLNSSG